MFCPCVTVAGAVLVTDRSALCAHAALLLLDRYKTPMKQVAAHNLPAVRPIRVRKFGVSRVAMACRRISRTAGQRPFVAANRAMDLMTLSPKRITVPPNNLDV